MAQEEISNEELMTGLTEAFRLAVDKSTTAPSYEMRSQAMIAIGTIGATLVQLKELKNSPFSRSAP